MAITLNANKFIGTISNLIAYSNVLDNYKDGGLDKLLNTFRDGDISNGDSKRIFTATLPSVSDYSANSTVLTSAPPTVTEQVVSVSAWKKVQLTINQYLMKGAFDSDGSMATLVAYLMKTMQVAKKKHMYDTLKGAIDTAIGAYNNKNTPGKEIVVTGQAIADGDDVQTIMSKKTYNTTELFKAVKNEIVQYSLGTRKAYKDATDNTGRDCLEDATSFVWIMSPKLKASLDVDALAVLLNSEKLTTGITVEIVEMNNTTGDGVSVLCSKDAFTYGFFYQVATSFFDPSNLNTNHWLHFSYYIGKVEYAPFENIKLTNYTF